MQTPQRAQTVSELIPALAAAYGDRPAVVLGDDVLTYRALDDRSAVIARGLLTRGVAEDASSVQHAADHDVADDAVGGRARPPRRR